MYACCQIHKFSLAHALRHMGGDSTLPTCVLDQDIVLDATPAALRRGVRPGQRLEQAIAYCPEMQCLKRDVISEQQLDAHMAQALSAFSGYIQRIDMALYLLDLGSTPKIAWEKEGAQMIAAVHHATGFRPSVGMSSRTLVAQVAAERTLTGRSQLIEDSQIMSLLSEEPLDRLPLSPINRERLHKVGVATLGRLLRLGEKEVTRLFGDEGETVWAALQGVGSPEQWDEIEEDSLMVSHLFDAPVQEGMILRAVVNQLTEQLCEQLNESGQMSCRLIVRYQLEGAAPIELAVPFASPISSVKRMQNLLTNRLEQLQIPSPVEGMTLAAVGLVPLDRVQQQFWSDPGEVSHAVRRVLTACKAKGRAEALLQVVWDDPHSRLPERRGHLGALVDEGEARPLWSPVPVDVKVGEQQIPTHVATKQGMRAVQALHEQWRLEEEWWRSRPVLRDYYLLLLENGDRVRIYLDRWNNRWYRQLR